MENRVHKSCTRSLFLAFGVVLVCANASIAGEGLRSEIENVAINSLLQPEVTFTLTDNQGNPLMLEDVSARFILARLEIVNAEKGSERYYSYTTRTQTVPEGYPNAGQSAVQATYDSGGTFQELGPGRYQYIFSTALPNDYNQTLTHTMSAQIERETDEKLYVANPLFHFVPAGGDVEVLRNVVTTQACNKCHTSLGIHGGGRKEVGLCLLCHNPQSTDPDTGNTVDMAIMTHKIHRGAGLPSVQAGEPYKIVGYRQSVHNYSHVEFPMDIRNCQVCHAGERGHVYKTAPTRAVCGSCHDNINFETGEGHGVGIPQYNDSQCTACHIPEGPEFGIGIAGAHTVPTKSEALKGLNAEIAEVMNAEPGERPIVHFTLQENDGTSVQPSSLSTLAITFGGPTREYTRYFREDGSAATREGDVWSYMFTDPIPLDAQGTYSFAIEARRNVVVKDRPEGQEDVEVTEAANNPVKLVAITTDEAVPRRHLVDLGKCNDCHDQLSFHGSLRNQIDYCVVCHNPTVSDIRRRPEDAGGGESVGFAYMIHKIHTGHELEQDYTVYGYGNRPHDYNEVLFPGNRKECSICHVEDVPALPISQHALAINFVDKDGEEVNIPPTTAACTSCHDMRDVVAHAKLNTTSNGVESCAVCHRTGRHASVEMAHEQDVFLHVSEQIGPPDTSINFWDLHR